MSKQKLGKDNWLHIATSAIANYAEDGGVVQIAQDENAHVVIALIGVAADDARLHESFRSLVEKKDEQI